MFSYELVRITGTAKITGTRSIVKTAYSLFDSSAVAILGTTELAYAKCINHFYALSTNQITIESAAFKLNLPAVQSNCLE